MCQAIHMRVGQAVKVDTLFIARHLMSGHFRDAQDVFERINV
jgi:hypothetical protein